LLVRLALGTDHHRIIGHLQQLLTGRRFLAQRQVVRRQKLAVQRCGTDRQADRQQEGKNRTHVRLLE
jgi:hypothetical protein